MYSLYNSKDVLRYAGLLIAMMAASYLTGGWLFGLLSIMVLGFIAQKKVNLLLFVIVATTCFMITNSRIVSKGIAFVACTKALLLVSSISLAAQVFGRRHSAYLTPLLSIMPYLLFMAVTARQGWSPAISYLKLFLFTSVFFAYYGCCVMTINGSFDNSKLRSMVLGIAIIYIFGSILLIPFPGISYMSPEELLYNPEAPSLYCGMCNHSQALGPLATIFGVLLYSDLAFSIQKPDKLYISLILSCAILVYMTSSRTAMASFIAGIAFTTFYAMKGKGIKQSWRRKVSSFSVIVVATFAIVFTIIPSFRAKIAKFAVKYSDTGDITLSSEAIWKSREGKLEGALYNWRSSPYIGNGFQVSADMAGIKITDFKQMLTAPVEKSTWTYAILEEGGIIGMCLFVLFILISLGLLIGRKGYITASLLFTFILSNMGEFTIFSMSADGGIFWLLVFIGAVMDHKRLCGFGHSPSIAAYVSNPNVPFYHYYA